MAAQPAAASGSTTTVVVDSEASTSQQQPGVSPVQAAHGQQPAGNSDQPADGALPPSLCCGIIFGRIYVRSDRHHF